MQTWDAIRARRNVRSYQTEPVPAADLDRIAEAAWRAPSASNRQHWDFVIVTDPDQLRALSAGCRSRRSRLSRYRVLAGRRSGGWCAGCSWRPLRLVGEAGVHASQAGQLGAKGVAGRNRDHGPERTRQDYVACS